MATTYELIASQTLGTATSSVEFTSIPGSFDDVVLHLSVRTSDTTNNTGDYSGFLYNYNGSTANYSSRELYGTGSGAASVSRTTGTDGGVTYGRPMNGVQNDYSTTDTFTSIEWYIPNYALTTVAKSASITSVGENNATDSLICAVAALWDDTSAITSIKFVAQGSTFMSGSSFFLYGITKS
jgi:hypothetical protein